MWCFPGHGRTIANDEDDDDDDDDDDDEVGYILGVLCIRITLLWTSYKFRTDYCTGGRKKPNKKSICSSKLNRIQNYIYMYRCSIYTISQRRRIKGLTMRPVAIYATRDDLK
jgi:hypothetical protein